MRSKLLVAVLFTLAEGFRTGTDLKEEMCPEPETSPKYFRNLRSSSGVTTCSKKDVCLLMRQLDAYFYARARKGELVDYGPRTGTWVRAGKCQQSGRIQKLAAVTSITKCKAIVKKFTKKRFRIIKKNTYPWAKGCLWDYENKRGYFNKADSNADAGTKYIELKKRKGSGFYNQHRYKVDIGQFCYYDQSLDEAAASYYSPYKLKASMIAKPEMSTSCSFGMMASLHRVGLTDSPCAEILTGAHGSKAKNLLIEQITNKWCPNIWTEAIEKGSTCSAERFPTWAHDGFVDDPKSAYEEVFAQRAEYLLKSIGGGETKADLMKSRTPKMGLPEGACSSIEDEMFDDFLQSKGDEAPDPWD
ncbi:unnamed protein product [Durusdinium trenchii]|uniref:Uncharacterized protein n=2 Tax=Durusdinium trenchii TaxID=1381693 RepID=A0ABP0P5V8_9DINO